MAVAIAGKISKPIKTTIIALRAPAAISIARIVTSNYVMFLLNWSKRFSNKKYGFKSDKIFEIF